MISFDIFTEHFLRKINEFDFIDIGQEITQDLIDSYMKSSISKFYRVCKFDLINQNSDNRVIDSDIPDAELYEIAEIISDGMIVQWLKPFLYNQELLESNLNTRDFTGYSPAELLCRVGEAHDIAEKRFKNAIKSYSYDVGDLEDLHL